MKNTRNSDHPLRLAILGVNETRIWSMTTRERIIRMAYANGVTVVDDWRTANLVADAGYAFDALWLQYAALHPETVIMLHGEPVLAHVHGDGDTSLIFEERRPPAGFSVIAVDSGISLPNPQLRKRETPFALKVTAESAREVERASYFSAYKGVTDLLTKYLWPEWALVLTRTAARLGMSPNMITSVGLVLCVATVFAFLDGHYWIGMVAGLVFMVLDTVDGKLARCTITSSSFGNMFDHGIDLIHPPIWWWAWAMGLETAGRPLPPNIVDVALLVVFAGYIVQRLIEGTFIASFGMHIHVWQRIDSWFRLITARRNPNMLLLFLFLCIGRPDWGLIALAAWTLISCLFHIGRLVQAWVATFAGRPVDSWLG
jgi:phosphatidylglycerophosphate synthase